MNSLSRRMHSYKHIICIYISDVWADIYVSFGLDDPHILLKLQEAA